MHLSRFLLTALAIALPGMASALDFRSAGEVAVLYDAPSTKGKKLWIIARGTPVEVVISLDKWVKVRDASGTIAWIERASLADQRTVIVTAATAEVRQAANASSPLVFSAVKDVVLNVLDNPNTGWIKVKHRDGSTGYIRASDVWGG
ncbi:MAG: SH3 domain-containing protein [Betaproteobacteria bacterium]|nr:SH3 domain-containing protein [Betaproteobacteria bacterium]